MATHAHSAVCSCGQVVFDLARKKPGHVLTCPWCKRRFVVKDGNRIEELREGESTVRVNAVEQRRRPTLIIRKRKVTTMILKRPPGSERPGEAETRPGEPLAAEPSLEKPRDKKEASGIGRRRSSSVFSASKVEMLKKAVETGHRPPSLSEEKTETKSAKKRSGSKRSGMKS